MRKNKKLLYRNIIIAVFSFTLFSFLGGFFGQKTTSGRIDALTYEINDYNKHTINRNFIRPFVRIESKEKRNQLYNDLFTQFYYSDDSGSIRQPMANDCYFSGFDKQISLNLYSQNTFSIQTTPAVDGGYRIDYGVFHAYFSENELHGKTYLGKRFNCDSYIFISDTLADMLLDKYGLERSTDSYLKLILEEQYAKLSITVDESKELTFSINNIIYSDKRTGPRCLEFNQCFGLINHYHVANYLQPAFEIDFKAYSYYIGSVLNKCDKMGYSIDSFSYRFFEYDYSKDTYNENTILNNEYILIRNNNHSLYSVVFIVILTLSLIIFALLTLLLVKSDIEILIIFATIVGFLTILSVLSNFVYISYLTALVPLGMLIVFICLKGGKIFERISTLLFKKQDLGKRVFYEIEI